ncbi:MAG: NTP transferase domain-containing protein, partial [Candidatus Neomarinimicrobiota bacterium]
LVIWANHLMRTAVTAMQQTARQIYSDQSLHNVENEVATVSEIFRLQGADELKVAEKRYLPISVSAKAIIVAASRGANFGELTLNKPKALLEYEGETLLHHLVKTYKEHNINDINVVVGYKAETVKTEGIKTILNTEWKPGGIASSLYKAIEQLDGPVVLSYGDILYESSVLNNLLETPEDIILAVDTSWTNGRKPDRDIDAVIGEKAPSEKFGAARCIPLAQIGTDIDHAQAHGEWIGLAKLSSDGASRLKAYLEEYYADEDNLTRNTTIVDLFKGMLAKGIPVYVTYFRGHWLDVDGPEDLKSSH